MRFSLFSLVLLVFAPSASADTDLCQLLQPCKPPARYASGPFIAKPAIREVSAATVNAGCGVPQMAAGHGALGCAIISGDSCTVLLPIEVKAISPRLFQLIREHELAHCRGWVHGDFVAKLVGAE